MINPVLTPSTYLLLTVMLPMGEVPSPPKCMPWSSPNSGAQMSNCDSLLKFSSSAPATAPVAMSGADDEAESHANVAVREMSLSFMSSNTSATR